MSALGMDQGEVYEGLGMGLTVGTIVDAEAADTPLPNVLFWAERRPWFWIDPVNDLYFIAMAQVTSGNYFRSVHGFDRRFSEAVYASVVKAAYARHSEALLSARF